MVTRRYIQLDGNDEGQAIAVKHALKIDPPWANPSAGWVARAVAFHEAVRSTCHLITMDGQTVADQDMFMAWAYQTIHEDRPYLPGTDNPAVPFAVLWGPGRYQNGIGLDAQTQNNDPAYRMFVSGRFRGQGITSETVHLGAIGEHVTLDVVWALEPAGTPPPPPPSGSMRKNDYFDAIISAATAGKLIP